MPPSESVTEASDMAGEESIDWPTVGTTLRRGWWIIATTCLVALLLAVIYLRTATYSYTATMIVTPAQNSGMDGLSSRLGSLGGLASAVGVSLPDGAGGGTFKLYIEGLRSYDIARILASDPMLLHRLYPRKWNPVTRQWRRPEGLLVDSARAAKAVLGVPDVPWRAPDAAQLQILIDKRVSVEVNPRSPVATITFDDEDPAFARLFLERLHATVDGLLRRRTLLRTNDYIAYLTGRLRVSDLPEQKQSIVQTLADQERLRMAVSSSRPFAAEVFSGPAASSRPTSPMPVKVLVIALVVGIGLGTAIVLRRGTRRRGVPLAD